MNIKRPTDSKAKTLIKRLFKQSGARMALLENKAMIIFKDKFAFVNPYYVFISESDYEYEHIEKQNDVVEKLFEQVSFPDYNTAFVGIENLKEFIKEHKKDKKPFLVADINEEKVYVNPNYLLDCMMFCGVDNVMVHKALKPILIRGEKNRAMLMPMRVKE